MRWRDIRFEKPAIGDKPLWLCSDRGFVFSTKQPFDCIAWMPSSEFLAFDRVPDPPDGWRFVEKGEAFDNRAQYWSHLNNVWLIAWQDDSYDPTVIYIVPIDPPKPEKRYRPFASAAEFAPHRDKWICTPGANTVRRVDHYNDQGVNGMTWESLFRNRTFEDGSPCGVEVSE